jgi:hypothetical protein
MDVRPDGMSGPPAFGRAWMDNGGPHCIAFGGLRVDDAIEEALLGVVGPGAIAAATAAAKEAGERRDQVRDALNRDLEAARYAADRPWETTKASESIDKARQSSTALTATGRWQSQKSIDTNLASVPASRDSQSTASTIEYTTGTAPPGRSPTASGDGSGFDRDRHLCRCITRRWLHRQERFT